MREVDVASVVTPEGKVKLAPGQTWVPTKGAVPPARTITAVGHMSVTYAQPGRQPKTIDDDSFVEWIHKWKSRLVTS